MLQLFLQTGLPLFAVIAVARSRNRTEWLLHTLLFSLVVWFLLLTARWDITSVWLRYVWIVALLVAAIAGYRRSSRSSAPLNKMSAATNGILIVAGVWLVFSAVRGTLPPAAPGVDVMFPLRHGSYYIGGGGSSVWLNGHRADLSAANDLALDIVSLNSIGNRANALMPKKLTDYVIFADTVYSPCDGVVLKARDGIPDGVKALETNDMAGNHIIIRPTEKSGIRIIMAHFKIGSIKVATGDSVTTNSVLGLVGQSGRASQPHLHIHAARAGNDAGVLDGQPVALFFDGQFLSRNQIISYE